jgi:hypothetical protein
MTRGLGKIQRWALAQIHDDPGIELAELVRRYLALEDHMPASATPMTPTYHRSAMYRAVDSLIARGLVEHYRLISGYGLTGWCLQPRWRPLAVRGRHPGRTSLSDRTTSH